MALVLVVKPNGYFADVVSVSVFVLSFFLMLLLPGFIALAKVFWAFGLFFGAAASALRQAIVWPQGKSRKKRL